MPPDDESPLPPSNVVFPQSNKDFIEVTLDDRGNVIPGSEEEGTAEAYIAEATWYMVNQVAPLVEDATGVWRSGELYTNETFWDKVEPAIRSIQERPGTPGQADDTLRAKI